MKQMNKTKLVQTIFMVFVIATLIAIFSFSNQNGESSEGLSRGIAKQIVKITNSKEELENLNESEIQGKINKADAVVRKLAHFTIYTVLGISLMLFFSTLTMDEKIKIIIVVIIGVVYATTDEIHQYFVSERNARVTDVMIDTAGVLFGIAIVNLIKRLISSKKS